MFSQIKKIGKETFIYGISGVLTSSVGFLLLPIYTRYLTPSDYGMLEILDTTVKILSMFLMLGITSGMFRSFFTDRRDKDYQKLIVSTTFNFSFIYHLIILICLMPFLDHISKILLSESNYKVVFFALTAMFFANMSDITMRIYRMREEAFKYVVRDISIFIVMVLLNILFVAGLKRGVLGILESRTIAFALLFTISLPVLLIYFKPRCSLKELKSQLSFGIPFVPMNLASWVLLLSDRYFLKFYCNLREVGIYSLGCKFGIIITILLSQPFFLAWGPRMYIIEKEKNAPQIYSRILTYFFTVGMFMWLALCLFGKEAVILMATPRFYSAYKVIPLICMASLLGGLQHIFRVGLNLKRKTYFLPLASGTAAVANLILNYLLIPSMGMIGAAIATLTSYIVLSILNICFSNHYYFIPYETRRLAKIFTLASLLYLISILLPPGNLFFLLLIKILLLIAFPIIICFGGILYSEEIIKLKSFFSMCLKTR